MPRFYFNLVLFGSSLKLQNANNVSTILQPLWFCLLANKKSSLIMKDICWTFSLDNNSTLPSLILMCWFNGSTHAFICIDTSSLQERGVLVKAVFTYSNLVQETCKYLILLIQSNRCHLFYMLPVVYCVPYPPFHQTPSASLTPSLSKTGKKVLLFAYVCSRYDICLYFYDVGTSN